MLNVLCDNSLITGFGYDQKVITPKTVKEVIADFSGPSPGPWKRLKSWFIENPPAKENDETAFDVEGGLDVLLEPRILRVVPKSHEMELPLEPFHFPPGVGKPAIPQVAEPLAVGDPKPPADSKSEKEDPLRREEDNGHAPTTKPSFLYRFFTEKGSLPTLVAEVYGYCNEELISIVKQANPKIQDFNRIKIGQIIRFPALD